MDSSLKWLQVFRGEEINKTQLDSIECFLLDLDGTLCLGEKLFPGAVDFINFLQNTGRRFLILTNNSSKDRTAYQQKLDRMGIQVSAEQIFTSGDATAFFLKQNFSGTRLYVAGTIHLKSLLQAAGFSIVEENPDGVIVGFDTNISYNILSQTCDFVRSGLPYFATHPDLNCPVEGGFIPDTGATIAFIAASTGRQPDAICGKPFSPMVDALSGLTNCMPEKMVMIGDRLNTDIALGQSGIKTILVLSGETTMEDLDASPYKPDYIYEDIAALFDEISRNHKIKTTRQ
jgi:HAD superfamily hydrolase (TIGR01450 family)